MKLYYFNDTKKRVRVCIGTLVYTSKILEPAEGAMFDIDAPDGGIPFVKVWENHTVLLAVVPENTVPHVTPQKR